MADVEVEPLTDEQWNSVSRSLDTLVDYIARNNVAHGFRDGRSFEQVICLLHEEVTEIFGEYRSGRTEREVYYVAKEDFTFEHMDNTWNVTKGDRFPQETADRIMLRNPKLVSLLKPEGVPIELADLVIRALDNADEWGFSLTDMIRRKMEYNVTRPYRHGKKF